MEIKHLYDGVFVAEMRPAVRTLSFINYEGFVNLHRLYFPHCIFYGTYIGDRNNWVNESFYIGLRDKSIKSFSDKIYVPNLPHVSKNGEVCFSEVWVAGHRTRKNLIRAAINDFWQSCFSFAEYPYVEKNVRKWISRTQNKEQYYSTDSGPISISIMVNGLPNKFKVS